MTFRLPLLNGEENIVKTYHNGASLDEIRNEKDLCRMVFVKGINTQVAKETVLYEIEELFEMVLGKAKLVDLSHEELQEMLKVMYKDKEK